jgi:hypothetical protein
MGAHKLRTRHAATGFLPVLLSRDARRRPDLARAPPMPA